MTTETQQTSSTDLKPAPFGARLKSARESIGLERKDAAAQLRLSEKVIIMLEKERYPSDLPITFIRGYIRSYGKLLQIPELEILKALEPIQPQPTEPNPITLPKTSTPATVTTGNYFMQLFTSLIILTLMSLVAIWWYSHSSTPPVNVAENKLLTLPAQNAPETTTPAVAPVPTPVATQSPPIAMTAPTPPTPVKAAANPLPNTSQQPTHNDDEEYEPD